MKVKKYQVLYAVVHTKEFHGFDSYKVEERTVDLNHLQVMRKIKEYKIITVNEVFVECAV